MTNVGVAAEPSRARLYFDLGLRLLFAYQHEQACKLFLACLGESPDCAMAHGMVALCHSPNYNFKGEAYYDSTDHPEQLYLDDIVSRSRAATPAGGGGIGGIGGDCGPEEGRITAQIAALDEMMNVFPSQQVASKHARAAIDKVEQLAKTDKGRKRSAGAVDGERGNTAVGDGGGTAASERGDRRAGDTSRTRSIGRVRDDDESMNRSQCSSVIMEDAQDGNDFGGGSASASSSCVRSSDMVHIVMEDADDIDTCGDHDGPAAAPPSSFRQALTYSSSQPISQTEAEILKAIGILCAHPGIDPALSTETVSRPYANAMREVYMKHPGDAEVAYFFVESLMVINAWSLYEYPTGRPLTEDIAEIRDVLERSLRLHPYHAGLCHLFVHLSEMSDNPRQALSACRPLRTR